jgi:hypothetical protein
VIVLDENEDEYERLSSLIDRWCPEPVVGHKGGGRAREFTGRDDVDIPPLLPKGSTFVTTNAGDFYGKIEGTPGRAVVEIDLGKTRTPKEVSDVLHRLLDLLESRGQLKRARRVIRVQRLGEGYLVEYYSRLNEPATHGRIAFTLDRRQPPVRAEGD